MLWKQLFGKKSLEMLKAEAEGENRLRRILGPIALTSLGVGAIIGAGIFVMTGRVASAWSEYFNKFTDVCFGWEVPWFLANDPFSKTGAWFNLPAVVILLLVTAVLVIGIRESAASNTLLVLIKTGVVLFVVVLGI